MSLQDRKSIRVVVAVTIIKRDHHVSTASFAQCSLEVRQPDDIELFGDHPHLLVEILIGGTPQVAVE